MTTLKRRTTKTVEDVVTLSTGVDVRVNLDANSNLVHCDYSRANDDIDGVAQKATYFTVRVNYATQEVTTKSTSFGTGAADEQTIINEMEAACIDLANWATDEI